MAGAYHKYSRLYAAADSDRLGSAARALQLWLGDHHADSRHEDCDLPLHKDPGARQDDWPESSSVTE